MNKYDELMHKIGHMERLLSSYRANTDKGFVVFGDGLLYSDSTLWYNSNVPLKVPANIYSDIIAAMENLYEYIEQELDKTSLKLQLVNDLLERSEL